eukprot:365604-Chlamydomonas_euryale.AAC.2
MQCPSSVDESMTPAVQAAYDWLTGIDRESSLCNLMASMHRCAPDHSGQFAVSKDLPCMKCLHHCCPFPISGADLELLQIRACVLRMSLPHCKGAPDGCRPSPVCHAVDTAGRPRAPA